MAGHTIIELASGLSTNFTTVAELASSVAAAITPVVTEAMACAPYLQIAEVIDQNQRMTGWKSIPASQYLSEVYGKDTAQSKNLTA